MFALLVFYYTPFNFIVGVKMSDATDASIAKAKSAEANIAEANIAEANIAEANIAEANIAEANIAETNTDTTGKETILVYLKSRLYTINCILETYENGKKINDESKKMIENVKESVKDDRHLIKLTEESHIMMKDQVYMTTSVLDILDEIKTETRTYMRDQINMYQETIEELQKKLSILDEMDKNIEKQSKTLEKKNECVRKSEELIGVLYSDLETKLSTIEKREYLSDDVITMDNAFVENLKREREQIRILMDLHENHPDPDTETIWKLGMESMSEKVCQATPDQHASS